MEVLRFKYTRQLGERRSTRDGTENSLLISKEERADIY